MYEPSGQCECIGKPGLILKLPASRPELEGYIDQRHPHGINHLIIEKLGHKEILVAACDDGDVVAYYIKDVQREIEARDCGDLDLKLEPADHSLRPFFLQNVGLSAWGLAVHTNARQIAVSSNTTTIHIYAFGLVDWEVSGEGPELISSTEWPIVSQLSRDQHPAQNWHIELKRHDNNIPTVTFDNSGRDPEGRYLVSAEIGQDVIVWDIWEGSSECVFQTTLSMRLNEEYEVTRVSQRDWGWSVLCIDPASYWPCQGCFETFGFPEIFLSPPYRLWDNTFGAATVRDNQLWDSVPELQVEYQNEDDESGMGHASNLLDMERSASCEIENLEGKRVDTIDNLNGMYSICDNYLAARKGVINPEQKYKHQFDLLICTSKDIALMYQISPGIYDRVAFGDPFTRTGADPSSHLHRFQRLNMTHQIRELGIVIVGDQAGRVAVISLNKMKEAPRVKGLRIDRILPTLSQEKDGLRQTTPLMGMAVGPVNPGQDPSCVCGRTWRLMLFYFNHSLLVYHLRRDLNHGSFERHTGR